MSKEKAEGIVAIVLFASWLICIALVQVDLLAGAVMRRSWPDLLFWKKWDALNLFPRFTFFSWLPSLHYHILIREEYRDAEGEVTVWRQFALPRRGVLRVIWNPARRVRFAIEDACKSMLAHLGQELREAEEPDYDCYGYRFLRHIVASEPGSTVMMRRQFMIAQQACGAEPGEPEPLFVSPWFEPAMVLPGHAGRRASHVA